MMSPWLSIDSAPKDRLIFVLFEPDPLAPKWKRTPHSIVRPVTWKEPGRFWRRGGWYYGDTLIDCIAVGWQEYPTQ